MNRPTIGQILTIGSLVAVLAIASSQDVSKQVTAIETITPLATCASQDGVTDQATYPCVWDWGPASEPPRYLVYYRDTCPVVSTPDVACLPALGD
jgi:hypothetical protein